MKAKRCPVCDSRNLKWVYYAPPSKVAPESWRDMANEGFYPTIIAKRIECADCGATVPGLSLTLDEAKKYWNALNEDNGDNRYVLQRIGEEPVREVEE